MTTTLAAWVLTYLVHSTILVLGVAALVRLLRVRGGAAETAWTVALLAPLVTATLPFALGRPPTAIGLALPAPSSSAGDVAAMPAPVATTDAQVPAGAEVAEPASMRTWKTPRRVAGPSTEPSPVVGAAPSARAAPVAATSTGTPDRFDWTVALLAVAGAFAAGAFLLHGIRSAAFARRIRRRRRVTSGPLVAARDRLAGGLGLLRPVRLTVTDALAVPIAFGILRPEISIPARSIGELSAGSAESLLAHELAHHARRDPIRLALFTLVERLLAFQPLNRWARRRWQETAEFRCDARAAALLGSGLPLARCLTDVAEWLGGRATRTPALAMAADRATLSRRVEALVAGGTARGSRRLGAAALALGAALVVTAPGVGVGATERAVPPAAPSIRDDRAADDASSDGSPIEALDRELVALERELGALRASIRRAGLDDEVGDLTEAMTTRLERLRERRRALRERMRGERRSKGARR